MSTSERSLGRGVIRNPNVSRPTRGIGQTRLHDLSSSLSSRDLSVLGLISAHRYLTTSHVEHFIFVDHATAVSAARTCRRVLARLEASQLLARPIRRVGGLQAGSASSIWMVSSLGRRILNMRAGVGAIGRVREPGERFIQHYLAIADTRLALVDAERAGLLELGQVEIEPTSWRLYLGLGGQKETLKPDLSAVTTARLDGQLADFEDHWFIEVDRATESLPTLLGQCQQYEAYRRQGSEQQAAGVFPLVLWIVPDERRASGLRAAIQRSKHLDIDLYRICTPITLLDTVLGETS